MGLRRSSKSGILWPSAGDIRRSVVRGVTGWATSIVASDCASDDDGGSKGAGSGFVTRCVSLVPLCLRGPPLLLGL